MSSHTRPRRDPVSEVSQGRLGLVTHTPQKRSPSTPTSWSVRKESKCADSTRPDLWVHEDERGSRRSGEAEVERRR